jgi:ArsR family transcriptional regulator
MNEDILTVRLDAVSRIASAFTNPVRIRILEVLDQGPASVDVVADKTDQSSANTSAQLKVLHESGLVTRRKKGRRVFYGILPEIADFLHRMEDLAATSDDTFSKLVEEVFGSPQPLTDREGLALLQLMQTGDVTLVDARPPDEYEAGHVRDAINIPVEELQAPREAIPQDAAIVVYGRGRFCELAELAVRRFTDAGYSVRNLHESVRGWRNLELPTR